MAKNRGSKNNGNGTQTIEAPEGFGINVGRERGEGWVKKEEGNVLEARILGRYTYESRGKKRGYYQLKLLKPCKVEIEDPEGEQDDEGNVKRISVTMDEGHIVNLDETAKLADLEPFTRNGGIYDVWLVFGAKIDIGDGQTMWSMTGPKLRVVQRPSETPEHPPF